MTERIERVLVHVCDREGTVHGIGFLISRWYAVTCAHVVNAALHRKDLEARDQPGLDERVRLSFEVLDTKEIPDSAVVEWHPPRPFDEITTRMLEDVAVLWFDADVPDDLSPPAVGGPLTANRRVRCYGWPEGARLSTYAWGKISGPLRKYWWEVHDESKGAGYPIQPGFSGSPAFADPRNEIVGMVVAADRNPARRLSYIVPCDLLQNLQSWKHWNHPPQVRVLVAETVDPLDGVKRLLLFADQFEELYTLCHDEAERSLFIAVIAAIAKPVGDRNDLAFIATVRSEFLGAVQSDTRLAQSFRITSEAMEASEKSAPDPLAGFDDIKIKTLADAARMSQPEQYEGLDDRELAARMISAFAAASATGPEAPPAFPNDIVLLGAMTATQFEEAIVEPARRLGVSFETGLADEMREWVLRGRDALPLMEFALQRLWADQSEGMMHWSSYNAMDGVKGALAQQAEAFFKALPTDEERENVKRVLVALVRVARPGEEGEDTRQPRTRDDFGDALWPTVRVLADARLVVTSRDHVGRETAEIIHEALIRNWPRLKNQWLDEDREFLLWHARCEARALEWQGENDRDRALRGADLGEAERFLSSQSYGSVSARVRDFVAFSLQCRADETARAEADAIWNELELNRGEALEATDIVALHRLARVEREAVREAFCRSLALDEARSRRFNRHPYLVIRAAIGVAPAPRRRRLTERVLAPALGAPIAAECKRAMVMLAAQIAADLSSLAAKAVDAALDVITMDWYQLSQAVSALASRLDRDQAAKLVDAVLDAIGKTTDWDQLSAFVQVITALGPNPHQAAKAMDAVLDAIGKTTDWNQLSAFAQAVSALAPRLDRDQAAKLVDAGLDAIGKTTDWDQLSALAQAVSALAPRLDRDQAAKLVDAVLDAIGKTTDWNQLSAFVQAITALGPNPHQAAKLVDAVLDAIGKPPWVGISLRSCRRLRHSLRVSIGIRRPSWWTPFSMPSAKPRIGISSLRSCRRLRHSLRVSIGIRRPSWWTPFSMPSAKPRIGISSLRSRRRFRHSLRVSIGIRRPSWWTPFSMPSARPRIGISSLRSCRRLRRSARTRIRRPSWWTPFSMPSARPRIGISSLRSCRRLRRSARTRIRRPSWWTPFSMPSAKPRIGISSLRSRRRLRRSARTRIRRPSWWTPFSMPSARPPRGWYQLSQAVSALAPRLDRDQVAKLVDAGLDAIGKTTDWDQLSALAPLINDESLMRVVRGLLAHLKHCAGPADTAKCVSALLATARRSDDPTFVGTVFEGLKAPMAFGEATELALQALQESFPDSADKLKDLWCAADWAERTFPNLDLAAPPRWLVEDRA